MLKNFKPIEPFIPREHREIKSKTHAIDVVKQNVYYFYVISGYYLLLFFFAIYNAYLHEATPNIIGLIIAMTIYIPTYFVRNHMNKIASLFLIVISIMGIIYISYFHYKIGQISLIFVIPFLLLLSSLRIYKAVNIYDKLTKQNHD